MDVLLDTNALLWWLSRSPKLGQRARATVADPSNRVFVSAASAWEIAIKYSLGRLPLPSSPVNWLVDEIVANRFTPLAISLRHALAVEALPRHHLDPFDRLLIAQATEAQLVIVTGDQTFRRYAVQVIEC